MTIKQRLRNYSLNKLLKQFPANGSYLGFKAIKTVAIVYEQGAATKDVQAFAKKLSDEGKKVEALMFIPKKRKDITDHQPHNFFCKDDLNWVGKPKQEGVSDFTSAQYDVLITLNDKEVSPVQFITLSSKASFTIGLSSSHLSVLDLQVSKPEGDDYTSVFKEIDYYLRFINQ